MPGLFANGSSTIVQPMTTRPTAAPPAIQPDDQYWNQVYANQSREEQAIARAQQRDAWVEHGYTVLGYDNVPQRENGELVGYVWQQRRSEDVNGLPVFVVEQARQAIAGEQSARAALLMRHAESRVYLAKHQLSSQAAQTHVELHSAEAATAFRDATQVATRALLDLGRIADEASKFRAVISAAPGRRAAEQRRHEQTMTTIDTEEQTARNAAQRAGVKV